MASPTDFPPTTALDAGPDAPLRRAERARDDLGALWSALPDRADFERLALASEALASSRLAGGGATLRGWLTGDEAGRDAVEALRFALDERRARARPISMRLMNEVHRRLLAGKGRGARPGLEAELAALGKYLHAGGDQPELVRAGLIHARFVGLRPYAHGNGRTGRVLLALLLPDPLLAPSVVLESRADEYRRHLAGVGHGAWEPWLAFFLEALAEAAEHQLALTRDLLALRAADRERALAAASSAVSSLRLLARLPAHPLVTVADVTRLLGTTKPTAAKAVRSLDELGVLAEITGRRRDRAYAYRAYLDRVCGPKG
jgi:hypothetical protein